VKSYRLTRDLLADIEQALAENRPSFHESPLEKVAGLLAEGRHYGWVGIYLTLEKPQATPLLQNTVHPAEFAASGTRKKVIVTMKIAGREIGFLNVESNRENAFGSDERVLLERVAGLLAKFLTGPGKYLVRKAGQPEPTPRAAAAA
jgi:putative methionine-R-sulfoxide reductase with GAF domain